MKTCEGCKHAEWRQTAAGRRHPSGDGLCKYPVKMPILPASMYFIGCTPKPLGGFINRRKELKDHCPTYTRD